MEDEILSLKKTFEVEIKAALSLKDIDHMRVKYLGKKGPVQDLMKGLKDVKADQRPLIGKLINDVKEAFSEQIEDRFITLKKDELEKNRVDAVSKLNPN